MSSFRIELVQQRQAPKASGERLYRQETLPQSSFDADLVASWGRVTKAYSTDHSVDVKMRNGLLLIHVPVASREWAGDAGYGERDLPTVNSKVLILFPDGIVEEAVVIASALETLGSIGSSEQTSGLLASGKEMEALRVRPGGLKETYDKSSGNYKIEVAGTSIEIASNGNINITAKAGALVNLGSATNPAATGACNIPNCLIAGMTHAVQSTVKVPLA